VTLRSDTRAGGLSRRGLLAGAGAGAAGVALVGCATSSSHVPPATAAPVAFHGEHQAGIATDAQDRLAFAAFDVQASTRAGLVQLLQTWTAAAARMTAGLEVADDAAHPLLPPRDTGEATGLAPANLTITVGFGPSLFDGRYGLAARRPAALADLPAMPREQLQAARSGGDLCVQACADDPMVAFHAVRNLRRLAFGPATMRWTQLGFGRTSSTSQGQATPRNLMGFKDGTNNLKSQDRTGFDDYVWVGGETDQPWMQGGSYVVTRRIRMLLEAWDRDFLADQEAVVGRTKASGAPLGAQAETDVVPLDARDTAGALVVPDRAHIRLAAPQTNAGQRILRRGYSYTDGVDPVTGELDAGLFFIAYQKDPRAQFVPIQRRLATSDAMNEYIVHTSSALFACPPGVTSGTGYLGESLLA